MDEPDQRAKAFEKSRATSYLVGRNKKADELNANYGRDLARRTDVPIQSWAAFHNNKTSMKAKHGDVFGLKTFTGVCDGCEVMLLCDRRLV